MQRALVKETIKKVGEKVLLKGWVDTVRDHGKITFIDLRDRSGVLQCVGMSLPKVSSESVVQIVGLVKKRPEKLINKDIPTGEIELEIEGLEVLSHAQDLPIPINPKEGEEVDVTKRLDYRWMDLRDEEKRRIFEVWTSLEKGSREYLLENGYIQIYTPSILGAPSESGAEVFTVEYFDKKVFLAQSPQFYKQMAQAAGFEKVFMTGPVFRAEPSFTTRHMTEFTGWDFELSFIDSHHDVMDEEEKMLISGFKALNESLDLNLDIPERPFPRITMQEAKTRLQKAGVKSEKKGDVSPEEERKLHEIIKKETGSDFYFLIDYPIDVRPFYHMRHEDNPHLTKSFDLIYRGVEITTGAQREHRYEVLVKQAKEKGMDIDNLQFYLDFFKYGCPPHGGVGIGPGRIVMQILGLDSVKEATFLPRDVKRTNP